MSPPLPPNPTIWDHVFAPGWILVWAPIAVLLMAAISVHLLAACAVLMPLVITYIDYHESKVWRRQVAIQLAAKQVDPRLARE